MLVIYKEITAESIAVMLYHNIIIALAIKGTNGMSAMNKIIHHRINNTYT